MVTVTASTQTLETETSSMGAATRAGNVGSGAQLGGIVGGSGATNLPLANRNYQQKLASGTAGGIGVGIPNAPALNTARGAMEAVAQGADLGDLFEYKLKDRVTIRKNESALVPIVQARVSAEKVSLWNAGLGTAQPLRALWLTNSSDLTLDGGSFSILENEAFAGEGLTDSIKPGEKRLLSYAADLGVRVATNAESDPQRVTHVRIAHGVMMQTCELRQETTYTVRDDDSSQRDVIIEHPLRPGWLIIGDGPKPDETTSALYRFRVAVESKASAKLTVREAKPLETTYELTNLDDDEIKMLSQQKSINADIEAAFRKIVEQKARVAALEDEISKRDDATKKIYDDQQRLRENLKVLKGSAEERSLTQRYTQQLNDQETRLETLQHESADLQIKHDQAQADLDKMIETLTLDTTV
jgi:hypothetical protein